MSQTQSSNNTSNGRRLSLESLKDSLPRLGKGGTLAAAATVAAAAAAVAAVRKYRGRQNGEQPTIFEVAPNGDGWHVLAGESDEPAGTWGTKKEALAAARELANNNPPSRLVVHRQDGTIQDTFSYEN